MGGQAFILDANVFIEAARRYYAFDLVPKFWECLVRYAENGRICSIDRVKKELDKGKDDLATWANTHFGDAFCSTTEEDVIQSYGSIMRWVQGQTQFSDAAKAAFADDPDGWLVAYSTARNHIIVTHEQPAPDSRRKIPIPNICQAFKVRYVDTFTMLRELGVRLT